MSNNTECQMRRRAAREGLRLMKLRESSRHYHQYGPYALVDRSTNFFVAYGLDLDQVEEQLAS